MRPFLALAIALLIIAPASAADGPTPADDQAMKLWQRSVLSAFQKARAHEADITKGETEDTLRFPDLDALMPPQDMRARFLTSHYAEMDVVTECRQAVLEFRWLAGDREDVSNLYNPKIAQEVRDYVGSARRCETAAKLPVIGSRLREVADVIAGTSAAPEAPPASLGLPLPLHAASGGTLVDVTLNEVFHQMLKDGIEARTVTVFAHPGDVNGLRSTAAFLARAYLGLCHIDMVRVLVLRDDLPDQINHPGTWLDVNRIAGADYDPNKRVFSSTFDVEVAKSVTTRAEVDLSEFYDARMQYYQDQGMTDPDEVDAAASRDVVAKFKVDKDWKLPSENQTEMDDGNKVDVPDRLLGDTAIGGVLTPTCDRYAAPKG